MISNFFIQRPIFSVVLSIIITVLGIFSMRRLPVEQFPPLVPVQILVTTHFPGASASTMSESVAAPLEKAINGVENMLYMYSQSTAPGNLSLIVNFKLGTDPNRALTNVQNRVNLSLSALPEEVQKQGVVVLNSFPSVLLFIAIEGEQGRYNDIFLANFANTDVADHLSRVAGVNSASVINAKNYSMRLWLNTDKLAQYSMTVSDVISAVQEQSSTRAIGLIGQEPSAYPSQLTIPVNAPGRMSTPAEFENIILRANRDGSMVFLKDVSRVELGSQSYNIDGHLNGKTGAFVSIYQDPTANALDISNRVKRKLKELSEFFPEGITYRIPYDTSEYIKMSMEKVGQTLLEAALFVSLIIFLFLHSVRSSIIPIVAMIVSILGTFTGMELFGFSINTLTLFGLVLSVGIVVDDAIVVVENIERSIRTTQLGVKEAAIRAMNEVAGPVIATSCVLAAVFIPVSFIGGIAGEFFKQFAVTIAVSVLISGFVALSLSPVLAIYLLKPKESVSRFERFFNEKLEAATEFCLKWVKWVIHRPLFTAGFYLSLLYALYLLFASVPNALVPHEDQGLILISAALPDGASLNRVEHVSKKIEEIALKTPGVEDFLSFSGYSLLESIAKITNGTYFVKLKNWKERGAHHEGAFQIINHLNEQFKDIPEAQVTAFNPPDIPGIGIVGGIDLWIVNHGDANYEVVNRVIEQIVQKAKGHPEFSDLLYSIRADAMELFLDVDKPKARSFGVRINQIYEALQVLLGSVYINQFNKMGGVYQVVAQAESAFRSQVGDIGDVYVRSEQNQMIPLKSLVTPRFAKGPSLYQRFNGSPAGLITVIPKTMDIAKIITLLEEIARPLLPPQMSYEWGGIALQTKEEGGVSLLAPLSSLFLAFLILAALYERWSLPMAILISSPFAVFGAISAVALGGRGADIYFFIGTIALIGLTAKNAILIVEFANQKRKEGVDLNEAALQGTRLRFRAIIMTSIATIAGALPLVITSGAGAAGRKSVGTGIIGGMIVAMILGLLFVPMFYKMVERFSDRFKGKR